MQAFSVHSGVASPLLRINIDTDAIIPSREIRGVAKTGLADGLFAVWRYLDAQARTLNPEFVLNQAQHRGTSILLGGENFGCGSSREHAVWALLEYGIRAIIAPSFGAIFYQNCVRNGIVPVVIHNDAVVKISEWVLADASQNKVRVDLTEQGVFAAGERFGFDISANHQEMLLNGLDAIGVTLKREAAIAAFETHYYAERPWLK